MAASNSENTGSGRKNYYNFSYGKLSSKQKEIPNGFDEIKETDLKSKMDKVEQIDLRNKFINKGTGERPYVVFNDNITGTIQTFEQVKGDKGTNFVLGIVDTDGDTSNLQCKLYGKYTENLLNRLVLTSPNDSVYFFPYAIPAEMKDDQGKDFKFYNQGVSVQVSGKKILPKYNKDNNYTINGITLPPTERVENAEGEMVTSRVKRINFLWAEFISKFGNIAPVSATKTENKATPTMAFEPAENVKKEVEMDSLPF
jgi:hypothetical protein